MVTQINHQEILGKFQAKHKIHFEQWIDEDHTIVKFNNNLCYDIEDIFHDIENDIPKGKIEEYARQGTDHCIGKVNFKTWLKKME